MTLRCQRCGNGEATVADQEELEASARYLGRVIHWRCATRHEHLVWLRRSTARTADILARLDPDMELPGEVYDAHFASLDLLDALERDAA
jgi:hypothetical protein